MESGNLHSLLARKLQGYDVVTDEEVQALARSVSGTRTFEAGSDMVGIDQRPTFSTLLIEGWAARYRDLDDGTRQFSAIHVPGDFIDLHSFLLHKMDHGVLALTPCRIAAFPHENLRRISENQPHLTRLLWLNTLVDAAIHRGWIFAMGSLQAEPQLAHLMCELYLRLQAVDLVRGLEFDFPLKQTEVAEALGISTVHINRTIRDIRKRGLISWRSGTITILDWNALVAFARFDPTYLSQMNEPR